jgi:hypothetical protein
MLGPVIAEVNLSPAAPTGRPADAGPARRRRAGVTVDIRLRRALGRFTIVPPDHRRRPDSGTTAEQR